MLVAEHVSILFDDFPVRLATQMLNKIVFPREPFRPGACAAGNRTIEQFHTNATVDRVAVPVEAVSCREWFRRAGIVVPMARDPQGAPLLGAFVRATRVCGVEGQIWTWRISMLGEGGPYWNL